MSRWLTRGKTDHKELPLYIVESVTLGARISERNHRFRLHHTKSLVERQHTKQNNIWKWNEMKWKREIGVIVIRAFVCKITMSFGSRSRRKKGHAQWYYFFFVFFYFFTFWLDRLNHSWNGRLSPENVERWARSHVSWTIIIDFVSFFLKRVLRWELPLVATSSRFFSFNVSYKHFENKFAPLCCLTSQKFLRYLKVFLF